MTCREVAIVIFRGETTVILRITVRALTKLVTGICHYIMLFFSRRKNNRNITDLPENVEGEYMHNESKFYSSDEKTNEWCSA